MRRRFFVGLVLLFSAGVSLAQPSSVTASVDREMIRVNESFRYILRVEGERDGRPDLSPLSVDFDQLDFYQTSSLLFANGRTLQIAEWVVELRAREPGVYTLPAIEVGGVRSNAVTIEILPAVESSAAGGDVFMEVELDRDSAYVQAQAVFTLRLYVGIGTGRQTLTAPMISGGEAIVEKLGADREFQAVREGRVYNVRERSYAIFPQAAGTLTIGPAVYDALIMPSRGYARQERVRSDSLVLEVKPAVPPPPEFPQATWLPASRLDIAESWSDGGERFEQGVPQTRTLDVVAEGLLETQLPDLVLEQADGLRQYPDQPELNRIITAEGIEAHRVERLAVIAQGQGQLELPPVEVPWFDVNAESWSVARIAGRTIQVLPGAASGPPEEPAAATGARIAEAPPAPAWWPWLSAGLGLGWLLTAAAWAYTARGGRVRRPSVSLPRPQSSRSLLKQLGAACRVHDPRRARDLLLDWSSRQFSEDAPQSLGALAARLNGPLADEIRALEAALYGPNSSNWRGDRLAALLQETQSVGRESPDRDKDPLVPLYR